MCISKNSNDQPAGHKPKKLVRKLFTRVLTGSAQGILIGVLPAAILKYVLAPLINQGYQWALHLNAILVLFNVFIPILIGMAVAGQFKMKALDTGAVMLATGAASGSIQWVKTQPGFTDPITNVDNPVSSTFYVANGSGDVINAIIVAILAVVAIKLLEKYANGFGSISVILTPLIVGGLIGLIGYFLSPFVGQITTTLGEIINAVTDLQPLLMSVLIAMAFAFLTITPISTVGIALAISLSDISAAAAGVGVVSTTVVLLLNSILVNKKGTTIAIFMGAMMGMMTTVFKKPITILAFMVTAGFAAIPVVLFNVQGTPMSAGLGWIGFGSPIQSMIADEGEREFISHLIGIGPALITWVVFPIVVGGLVNWAFIKWFKAYQPTDFKNEIK
ncbi:PTS sugar transporter subunit IIC [Lactobacillus sp. Sy-1]|uniref:PTS sugar transporter subunit IIC n=1 Tax=Lactobacillus sp. Sy-1 TaxID=2109645 RepID=UPI0021070699|nr:PTS sugar transporter subunit IIC [Lactobacillus sp. Sy-1]